MPELPEWRVFCATAKFHSISRAAESLGIGPPTATNERVLIASPDHPLAQQYEATIDEIARYPLTLLRAGTTARTMLEAEMKRQEIPYEVGIELDHTEVVNRYVSLGLGISVVPEFIVEPRGRENLAIIRVQGSYATEQIGAATLREKPPPRLQATF